MDGPRPNGALQRDAWLLVRSMVVTTPMPMRVVATRVRALLARQTRREYFSSNVRRRPRVHATSDDGVHGVNDDDVSWEALEQVYLLVFDLDTPREAIFTTSARSSDAATNAFVVFESMEEALRCAMRVSEVARDMPAVDSAPPAAVRLLCAASGYEVEFVRAEDGDGFDVPEVIVDEGETLDGDGALAMSAADLEAYLGGRSTKKEIVKEKEEEDDPARVDEARTIAARAVRDALRAPVTRVRDATRETAGLARAGARVYVGRAKSAVARLLAVAANRAANRTENDEA